MIRNILESFDFWGVDFTFLNNTKTRRTSIKGGILSLISIILSIIYIFNEFYNWLSVSYYTKYYQSDFERMPEINLIDYPKFMLAFCIGTENNSTVRDDSVIEMLNRTLTWSYVVRTPWLMEKSVNIPLETCKKSMFPKESVNSLTFRMYQNCLCADSSKLSQFNISYSFTDTYHSYLNYIINFRDDILDNDTRILEAYYHLIERQSRNFIYFVDSIGKIDDHSENFFSNYMNWKVNYLNPDVYYLSDVFLSRVEVKIDDNFFVPDKKKFTGIKLDKVIDQFNVLRNNTKTVPLSRTRFRASNQVMVMGRESEKFDSFIGNIISFLTIFFVFLAWVNSVINQFEANKNIVKILFKNFEVNTTMMKKIRIIQQSYNEVNYPPVTDSNPNISKKDKIDFLEKKNEVDLNVEYADEFNNNRLMTNNNDNSSKSPKIVLKIVNKPTLFRDNDPINYRQNEKDAIFFKNKDEAIKKIKEKGLTVDLLSYLNCVCCRNPNPNFDKALLMYYYYMDVSTYFRKMMEIDIIKFFLFSLNERKLISIIANPDFSTIEKDIILAKLNEQHDKDRFIKDFDRNIDPILKDVIEEARNKSGINKLLQLVKNGSHSLYED